MASVVVQVGVNRDSRQARFVILSLTVAILIDPFRALDAAAGDGSVAEIESFLVGTRFDTHQVSAVSLAREEEHGDRSEHRAAKGIDKQDLEIDRSIERHDQFEVRGLTAATVHLDAAQVLQRDVGPLHRLQRR